MTAIYGVFYQTFESTRTDTLTTTMAVEHMAAKFCACLPGEGRKDH